MVRTLLPMPWLRTQIRLTAEQRRRLDELCQREGRSLAEVIREAVDAYLAAAEPDPGPALGSTFGALPTLALPARGEWDRG